MKRSLFVAAVLALAFFPSFPGLAAVKNYSLPSPACCIEFEVGSTLHEVHGKVKDFKSPVVPFDFETGILKAPVEIRVPVRALDTANKMRDRSMWKMFDEKKHPEILWRTEDLACTSESAEQFACLGRGTLEVRGKSNPVDLRFKIRREKGEAVVQGTGTLSLKALDLHPPSVLGMIKVHDEVTLHINTRWKEASA